jgi:hypothetical protein
MERRRPSYDCSDAWASLLSKKKYALQVVLSLWTTDLIIDALEFI